MFSRGLRTLGWSFCGLFSVGLLRKGRLLEAVHGRVVLGARPEDLQADAALVELSLLGAHRLGHLPAQLCRAERAPLGTVADPTARASHLHRLADPEHLGVGVGVRGKPLAWVGVRGRGRDRRPPYPLEHLEQLGELRVGVGGEQTVARSREGLLVRVRVRVRVGVRVRVRVRGRDGFAG